MSELDNSTLIKEMLKAIYIVASRRTSHDFAVVVISSIIKNLEKRYDFLKYVKINSEDDSEEIVDIDSDINSVNSCKIGNFFEDIVQIAFSDLRGKTGQYFIKEIEENAGEEVISKLKDCGIDLELLKVIV